MERLFLAEVHSPAYDEDYNAETALEEMRDMRQVVENRLKNPSEYDAKGAKNEIDIIKGRYQSAGFGNYPKIDPGKEKNINEIIKAANNHHDPEQAAYVKFVQNAIRAATESITHQVAGYPDATAWVTKGSKSPGSNFYLLGTVGGNTFYGTLPQTPKEAKSQQKADNLEGKSTLEKMRYYKAQALADAAKKPESLHQKIMKWHQAQSSYAPIRNRQAGQAKPRMQADAAPWSAAELAQTPQMRPINLLQQNPNPAVTLMASIARSNPALPAVAPPGFAGKIAPHLASPPGIAPAVFYEYAKNKNNPWVRAAATSPAASLAKAALRPELPSIAPRMSAPSGYAGQRGGTPPEFELASMPNGPMQPEGGFAPRGHGAATASDAQAADVSLASAAITQRQVKLALRDYFNAQARLPPSGATAFDPRLTPAWAGQKIPG
jgi:hypothetical protein